MVLPGLKICLAPRMMIDCFASKEGVRIARIYSCFDGSV